MMYKKKFAMPMTSAQQTKEIKESIGQQIAVEDAYIKDARIQDKPDLAELGRQAKAIVADKAYNPDAPPPANTWPNPVIPTYALPPAPYREPKWITISEAAKHVKMSPVKFAKNRDTGPKYYRLKDKTILYNVHDVDDWVMSHAQTV